MRQREDSEERIRKRREEGDIERETEGRLKWRKEGY